MESDHLATDTLSEIQQLRADLADQLAETVELPEPGLELDLASRRASQERMLQHIVQSSYLHWENYSHVNRIRHMFLVDGFLNGGVAAENPMVLYAVSRSMLELSAFLHEVRRRLVETVERINKQNWQPLAEKFFALLVRARYGTSNPEVRDKLLAAGVPRARLQPFNITECMKRLATDPDNSDALARYDQLCDLVHHNLSSGLTAHSGVRLGDHAQIGAGALVLTAEAPIVRYRYPVDAPFLPHIAAAGPGFLRDARACVQWVNQTPQAPFGFHVERLTT